MKRIIIFFVLLFAVLYCQNLAHEFDNPIASAFVQKIANAVFRTEKTNERISDAVLHTDLVEQQSSSDLLHDERIEMDKRVDTKDVYVDEPSQIAWLIESLKKVQADLQQTHESLEKFQMLCILFACGAALTFTVVLISYPFSLFYIFSLVVHKKGTSLADDSTLEMSDEEIAPDLGTAQQSQSANAGLCSGIYPQCSTFKSPSYQVVPIDNK